MFKHFLGKRAIAAAAFCLCLISSMAWASGYVEATKQDILDIVKENKGKVVVVNVFASWCPPCRRETPDIVRFYRETSGEGIVFLGVSMDESGQDLENFIARFQIPYAVYKTDEDFLKHLGSYSIPQFLVFNKNGEQVEHVVGMMSFEGLMDLVHPYHTPAM